MVKELQPEDGSNPQNPEALEMGLLLYKAKLGQPRSDRLMSLLEDPENINRMNRAEAMLYTDQAKKMLYTQKGAFLCIWTKKSTVRPDRKGR